MAERLVKAASAEAGRDSAGTAGREDLGTKVDGVTTNTEYRGRLMALCTPEPNSGCWLWMGAVSAGGYGAIQTNDAAQVSSHGHRRVRRAHVVSYELHVGPIPLGLELDHLCRVRCCVNPQHLEAVTKQENIRRGEGGKHWSAKTHCPFGHEYDESNTYRYKGRRNCRACNLRRTHQRRNK